MAFNGYPKMEVNGVNEAKLTYVNLSKSIIWNKEKWMRPTIMATVSWLSRMKPRIQKASIQTWMFITHILPI